MLGKYVRKLMARRNSIGQVTTIPSFHHKKEKKKKRTGTCKTLQTDKGILQNKGSHQQGKLDNSNTLHPSCNMLGSYIAAIFLQEVRQNEMYEITLSVLFKHECKPREAQTHLFAFASLPTSTSCVVCQELPLK